MVSKIVSRCTECIKKNKERNEAIVSYVLILSFGLSQQNVNHHEWNGRR